MKLSEMFPSNYLKVDDLNGQDLTLTIDRVVPELLGQGREQRQKTVVYFKDSEKGLVLNKTNGETIGALYGPDSSGWLGRRITLWANPDVQFQGKTVAAIRVRHQAPAVAPAANGQPSRAAANPERYRLEEQVVDAVMGHVDFDVKQYDAYLQDTFGATDLRAVPDSKLQAVLRSLAHQAAQRTTPA